jgi:hypothetical protein
MKEEELNPTIVNTDVQSFVLGPLGHFGLGNAAKGIPSSLANQDEDGLAQYAAKVYRAVVRLTDATRFCCIDGRCRLCNADKSEAENRPGHIGGTLTLPAIAMTGGAPIVDTLDLSVKGADEELMTAIESTLDVSRSAHTGGCGGANGLIEDQQAVHDNPAITQTAGAVMNHEALLAHTKLPYDEVMGLGVQKMAGDTVTWLKAQAWDGPAQVKHATETSPAGVEALEVDETSPFKGHAEPAILLYYSTSGKNTLSVDKLEELGLGRPFIVSLNASVKVATGLAGPRGEQGARALLLSDLANTVAAGSRLATPETPVMLFIIP